MEKRQKCTYATPDCKILVPNVYKVITKDASKAGDVALGYFYCQHIKTGKGAGGTFSIKCRRKRSGHYQLMQEKINFVSLLQKYNETYNGEKDGCRQPSFFLL